MLQHGYPDLPVHKLEHEALTRQVLAFQDDFRSGHAVISVQLLTFLKEWLEKHIKASDRKYVPYLSKAMVT